MYLTDSTFLFNNFSMQNKTPLIAICIVLVLLAFGGGYYFGAVKRNKHIAKVIENPKKITEIILRLLR